MKVIVNLTRESTAEQTEFPLAVPVCAWCKPKPGAAVLEIYSHGICPRHLRMMRAKAKAKSAALN
jgi:hypothetical protein